MVLLLAVEKGDIVVERVGRVPMLILPVLVGQFS